MNALPEDYHTAGMQRERSRIPSIALLGSPNVGKSALFNALTSTYVTVSNYPGTTVEVYHGAAQIDGNQYEVMIRRECTHCYP